MGKHNGKARTSGALVGSALVNKARKEGKGSKAAVALAGRHTTDATAYGRQSVLETNDLNEMMNMADLAGRDFAADRGEQSVVVSTGAAVTDKDSERDQEARAAAQEKNRHRLRIPRRPHWDNTTTAEQLDFAERESFLGWRRDLANLEEEESLVLTPFEKNLEVWRQLWRVLERSHIVVQVLDARDPVTYRSTDLEEYARAINPAKASLLLLNKSDLLSEVARTAWADYLDSQGIAYIFWSAKLATADAEEPEDSKLSTQNLSDHRIRLLTCDELLDVFSQKASQAAEEDTQPSYPAENASVAQQRLVVGLTGYPNVGKSSTINALFGSKKTAVAATPGKTKHFQTLVINDQLLLCDCPGLVLPKYAHSKAEMVAAGVIPIDRLTDVRGPIDVVLRQAGTKQIEKVYNIAIPNSARRTPSATEALATLARGRGWTTGAGLPDEARAGRMVLKDFCDGKLVSFKMPPGYAQIGIASSAAAAAAAIDGQTAGPFQRRNDGDTCVASELASSAGPGESDSPTESSTGSPSGGAATGVSHAETKGDAMALSRSIQSGGNEAASSPLHPEQHSLSEAADFDDVTDADLALMLELDLQGDSGPRAKPQRAAHKFHNRSSRRRAVQV